MESELWARVKPIFHAAMDLVASERPAYLAEHCRDAPEVRYEVERLLSLHESSRTFFDTSEPKTIPLAGWGAARTLRDGEVLSRRFRIDRLIGRGGMGEVYGAWDFELKEGIALKTMRPELSGDKRNLARFKREIQLARKVTHRNICRIFDVGRDRLGDRDVVFLTMEYVQGETLSDYLKRCGPLSIEEARPLLRQMLEGLAALHDAQIIHRDFKSANVILAPSDEGSPRVVVTDFGLARYATLGDRSNSVATNESQLVGTPDYMAPEQLLGAEIGPYSDMYAFGVVTYEMLCGRRPYVCEGTTPMIVRRLTEAPTPPTEALPGIDPEWDEFIRVCLTREPRERLSSPRDALVFLRRAPKCHSSVTRSDAPPAPQPRLVVLRSRYVLGAALAISGLSIAAYQVDSVRRPIMQALCAGFAGSSWFCELPSDKDLAILPFVIPETTRRSEPLAMGLEDFVQSSFYDLYPDKREMCVHIRSRSGSATSYGAKLELTGVLDVVANTIRLASRLEEVSDPNDETGAARQLVRSFELTAPIYDVRWLVDRSLLMTARALALEIPDAQHDAWLAKIPRDGDAFAAYLRGLGLKASAESKVGHEAVPELMLAAEQLSNATSTYAFSWAHAALGDVYRLLLEKSEDPGWEVRARNAYVEALGLDPELTSPQLGLAALALFREDQDGAIEILAGSSRSHPFDYEIQGAYASVLEGAGRADAIEQVWKNYVESRPDCWYGYNELARFYLNHGRQNEAMHALQAIVRLAPNHAAAHHNLAFVFLKLGRYEDAVERAADSVRFDIEPLGYSTLGRAYLGKGCLADALLNLRQALEEAEQYELKTDHRYARRYLLWKNLADGLAASGQETGAKEAYRRTIEYAREFLADHPRHRVALGYLALGLAKSGDGDAAREAAEQALRAAPENGETLLHVATVFELGGLHDRALELLQMGLEKGLYISEVQQMRGLEHLRRDPRYVEMLAKLSLDADADPGNTTSVSGETGCPAWTEAGKGLRDRTP